MSFDLLDQIQAINSPFDDIFDPDVLHCGASLEPITIWTDGGQRGVLMARTLGWTTLTLWEVIDDAQATWNGDDDACWEL
jgi:hypothetical protein